MKFSIKDSFSKCDQIRSFLRIWSHLLKKSLMENFISCAVNDDDDDEWLYHCETIVRDPHHRKFLKRASTI